MGLVLVVYGSIQVWLSNVSYDNPLKRRFCAAWLCPDEFSDTRTFTMLQQSTAGGSAILLPDFQRALVNDPASAYAWANLAEVERDAGHLDRAKYCFQHAIAAGPFNPAILFRAANFAFLTGDRDATMHDLSIILRNPELAPYFEPAFLTYSRLDVPIAELLDKGIPPVTQTAEQFLEFWMQGNQIPEAKATWDWMMKHSLTTEKSGGAYIAFLVQNNDIDAAAREWRRANPKSSSNYQVLNWVFNNGFEMEPKPGPFDWHIETTPDVEATRVQDVSRDGQWSVELSFDGKENVDYHGVHEQTVISPGQWRVQAFLKLDSITTDQGISLRVFDPQNPARLDVHTDPLNGTTGWTEVERAFAVGPATKLVQVEIMRGPSLKFDNKISGRAWVDSLDLSPIR